MKIVVFYTNTNSMGKSDADTVFKPYAKNFIAHYSRAGHEVVGYPIACNVTRPLRRKAVLEALSKHQEIDMVAYFGHGLDKSIQIGFDTSIMSKLAEPLKAKGCKTVVLYACSAASNQVGGFAKVLAEKAGCRVIGHTTEGHAVYNPYLRYYNPDGTYGWYVAPKSAAWQTWRERLKKTDIAYEMPVVEQPQLLAFLGVDATAIA